MEFWGNICVLEERKIRILCEKKRTWEKWRFGMRRLSIFMQKSKVGCDVGKVMPYYEPFKFHPKKHAKPLV